MIMKRGRRKKKEQSRIFLSSWICNLWLIKTTDIESPHHTQENFGNQKHPTGQVNSLKTVKS